MRIFVCSEKMKRNIRIIADDPTVMPGTDVKNVSRFHDVGSSVFHGTRRLSGDDHANVLDVTQSGSNNRCDMLRPSPAWFIGCPANRHSADLDQLESSFLKDANLIGTLESFN